LFWQITNTTPLRRMTLHFSHIGLTDGLTFMIPFGACPATGLWLPPGPPLPNRGFATAHGNRHARKHDPEW
jgi:hypothetical protein